MKAGIRKLEMGLISQILKRFSGLQIHCSTHKFGSGCDIILWYHRKIRLLISVGYCSYHHSESFINPYCILEFSEAVEFAIGGSNLEFFDPMPCILVTGNNVRAIYI